MYEVTSMVLQKRYWDSSVVLSDHNGNIVPCTLSLNTGQLLHMISPSPPDVPSKLNDDDRVPTIPLTVAANVRVTPSPLTSAQCRDVDDTQVAVTQLVRPMLDDGVASRPPRPIPLKVTPQPAVEAALSELEKLTIGAGRESTELGINRLYVPDTR